MQRQGLMLVVSAPSGTGKSTLTRRLMREFPDLTFSVSCTTRTKRAGEVDGRDYHFLSMEEFERRRERGLFVEWAEVYGNYYGTLKNEVVEMLQSGRDVLFDIDVKGMENLKRNMPGGAYVFIFPPSLSVLRQRLLDRGANDQATMERRLRTAPGEIAKALIFDYWIVNDDLERAYLDLKSVYLAERLKPSRRPGLADEILGQT